MQCRGVGLVHRCGKSSNCDHRDHRDYPIFFLPPLIVRWAGLVAWVEDLPLVTLFYISFGFTLSGLASFFVLPKPRPQDPHDIGGLS